MRPHSPDLLCEGGHSQDRDYASKREFKAFSTPHPLPASTSLLGTHPSVFSSGPRKISLVAKRDISLFLLLQDRTSMVY